MATKKKTASADKTTFSQVIVWRDENADGDYEIKISRGTDETWVIDQSGTTIYITDDAAMAAFIDACSDLLASQK